MSAWRKWVEHPEQVWWRRAFFQIHFWIGAGIGAYVVLMSATGSMIVFRNELEKTPSLIPPVEWIVNLHENLLFGTAGRFVNGIGAIALVSLCLSGALIWWPGIAHWRRALTLDWRAAFARFSWDLHSALGFWGFLFVLMWGISGSYFAFPDAFNSAFYFLDPNDRFGDSTLALLAALHFGRFGLLAEGVWALLGLLPAMLAITGVFLCCRRVIFKAASVAPHSLIHDGD
jgi:uncharacterized iron-regulated membrane protein